MSTDPGAQLAEFARDTLIGPWRDSMHPILSWDEQAQLRDLLPHLTAADRFRVLADLCQIGEQIASIQEELNDRPSEHGRTRLAEVEQELQAAADKAVTP